MESPRKSFIDRLFTSVWFWLLLYFFAAVVLYVITGLKSNLFPSPYFQQSVWNAIEIIFVGFIMALYLGLGLGIPLLGCKNADTFRPFEYCSLPGDIWIYGYAAIFHVVYWLGVLYVVKRKEHYRVVAWILLLLLASSFVGCAKVPPFILD